MRAVDISCGGTVAEPLRASDVGSAGNPPVDGAARAASSPARLTDATIVALVAVAGAASWLVLFFPGFMSMDSAGQLLEARKGVFSDGHPPLLALLWRPLDRVVPGPFGILVLQTVLLWTGLAMLAARLTAPVLVKVAFLLLVAFAPPLVSIAGAIWKDVLMTALLLLAFARAGRGRSFWIVALLATMTRHNAIFAVAGAVALHFSTPSPSLARLARAAVASAALLAVSLVVNSALIQVRGYPTQMVALFDVVGIAAETGRVPELPPCFLRRQPIDAEDVVQSYDPRSIVYLTSGGGAFRYCFAAAPTSTLLGEWLGAITAHPGAYLAHRTRAFRHLLGVEDTPGNWIMTRSTYLTIDFHDLEAPAAQTSLQLAFERAILVLRPYGVFRPWIYAVLSSAALAIALRRRLWPPFFIALSGLVYEAGLFFVAPSEDYRYSLWMIVAGWTSMAWVVVDATFARRDAGA